MTAIVLRADVRALPLPDESVDLIVTSPPYFGLRSYTDNCPTCAETARARNRGYMERYCPGCGHVFTSGRNKCHKCDLTTLRTDATKAAAKTDCPDCGGTGQLHYDGQIGSEEKPGEWLASLLDATREWMRVLKPSGSIFVNLGDGYAGSAGSGPPRRNDYEPPVPPKVHLPDHLDVTPAKCLRGLPWRYALACTDQLGLILRRDIIWAKPNGLPESAADRCRTAHEYVFHMVRQARYYSAVDEIREPYLEPDRKRSDLVGGNSAAAGVRHAGPGTYTGPVSPLGKLPGSIWDIPSMPLVIPDHVAHARCCGGRKRKGCQDGVSHFAPFPAELPRRIIAGWSPPGVCTACGQGRRPVTDHERIDIRPGYSKTHNGQRDGIPQSGGTKWKTKGQTDVTITGYACACTPYTDHPGTGGRERDGQPYARETGRDAHPHGGVGMLPRTGPWREYHLDRWTPPPARPAVVLDPFGGTGTTALAASVLGRIGVTADRSADYCRVAAWRTQDSGERCRVIGAPRPPRQAVGQDALFSLSDLTGEPW
jgi:DNA modification methylase